MKKTVAILMAVLMLFGILGAAPARVDAAADGTDPTKLCPHTHTEVTTVRVQPTCTQKGSGVLVCKDCGRTLNVKYEIPALGHDWGGWQALSAATCTESYKAKHVCRRCGLTETKTQPALGHEFGEWYVKVPPKYGTDMVMRRDCVRGDIYEEKTVPVSLQVELVESTGLDEFGVVSGETVTATYRVTNTSEFPVCVSGYEDYSDFHTTLLLDELVDWPEKMFMLEPNESGTFTLEHVIDADDAAAGYFARYVGASGSVYAQEKGSKYATTGYVYSNTVKLEEKGEIAVKVTLELTGRSVPDIIDVGTVITGTYTATNRGSVPVCINSYGNDDRNGSFASGESVSGKWPDEFSYLEPGKSASFQIAHKVTGGAGGDFAYGELIRKVRVSGVAYTKHPGGQIWSDGPAFTSNNATLSVEIGDPPVEELDEPFLYLEKRLASAIPERGFFAPDEVVTYSVTISNLTDETISGIALRDVASEGGITLPTVSIGAHKSETFFFSVTVTADMAAAGSVTDYVLGAAGGMEYVSNVVSVPTGFAEPVLLLEKTETSKPKNNEYYKPGEVIKYSIVATNTSSEPIKNCEIYDLLAKDPSVPVKKIGTLKPGASAKVTFQYTVQKEDWNVVMNSAFVTGKDSKGNAVEAWADCTSVTAAKEPEIVVTKTCTSSPKNGSFYTEGEIVSYSIQALNVDPELTVTDVALYDAHYLNTPLGTAPSLAPMQSLDATFSYTVTGKDAELGYVNNTAFATYRCAEESYMAISELVRLPAGIMEGLSAVKAIVSQPTNGPYYRPGDPVTFRVTVYNNTMFDCTDVRVNDGFTFVNPMTQQIGTLKAGESASVEFVCDTSSMMDGAMMINGAYAVYTDAAGNPGVAATNKVSFEVREEKTGMKVSKREISKPSFNKWYYETDEPVTYEITVTNTGDTQLAGGEIIDNLAGGEGTVGTFGALKPGESTSVKWTYTGGDNGMGFIHNQAAAIAEDVHGAELYEISNVVRTNFGHIEDFEDRVTPNPGDACSLRLLTGEDGGLAYAVKNCGEHAKTDAQIREAAAKATDAEELKKVYETGSALWADAVDALYAEMLEVTPGPESRTALMGDRKLFKTEIGMKRELLTAQYPDSPEIVEELLCGLWQEKCADLCGLFHSEAGTAGVGAAEGEWKLRYDDCRMDLTEAADGLRTYALNFCPDHAEIGEMTAALVQVTDANGLSFSARKWAQIRGLWETLLASATAERYAAADESMKALLLKDRLTYESYVKNYEELLSRFCSDEGYADELLTREFLLRTLQLCGNTSERVWLCKAGGEEDAPGMTDALFGPGTLKPEAPIAEPPAEGPHVVEKPEEPANTGKPVMLDGPGMVKEKKSTGWIIGGAAVLIAAAAAFLLIKRKKS